MTTTISFNEKEFQTKKPFIDRLFVYLLPLICVFFGYLGVHLTLMPHPVWQDEAAKKGITTHFIIQQQTPEKKPVVKQITPEKKVAQKSEEPVDLTNKPKLDQKVDDVQPTPPTTQPVRRVYGLRKVFSVGLGAGGSMSSAVIGKLGNTLATDVDTFKATQSEIKGTIVSAVTVTTPPKFKKIIKPEYSKAMLDARAEGVVKVKVLVDIDGKVKKALVVSDIGFDSGAQALKATQEMLFEPALKGTEPVAVWIIVPIRFVMMG